MRMEFKRFTNTKLIGAFEEVCAEATAFASNLGPDRVLSISHSQAMTTVVVIVWYWADDSEAA